MVSKFLSIHIILIAVLSSIAAYTLPDLSQSNWDTVLFLTPYGIVHNYLHKADSVLWTFYSDPSSGQLDLSYLKLLFMLAVYILMSAHVFYFIKKQDRP